MKLITWNTQWCQGLDGVVSPERIVDQARALADFDVLCLQEIAVHYPGLTRNSAADQVAHLRTLLPGYALHFGAAVQERGPNGEWQQFGNLIATRLPVLAAQHYPLPWPADSVRSMPRMCSVVTVQAALGAGTQPVRVMTTHLEYYSARQRMAQVQALCELHRAACEQAAHPPLVGEEPEGPFQPKPHTPSAVLCGDFNMPTSAEEYAVLTASFEDLWPRLHGEEPHDPTFLLYERRWGPKPIACDFVFASSDLAARARHISVHAATQASDHQPVLVEFG